MSYVFLFDSVAVWISYIVDDQAKAAGVEAGARIEVRRLDELPGHRPLCGGFTVPTVRDGGIWRADLLVEIDPPSQAQHYHHHPNFDGVDVGTRVFEPAMQDDPISWSVDQLAHLDELLSRCGAADVIADLDMAEVARSLPAMRRALEECMARIPELEASV